MKINESLIGREFEVLVEGPSARDSGVLQGDSRCYRMMHFPGDVDQFRGELVTVRATGFHKWGLSGEIV